MSQPFADVAFTRDRKKGQKQPSEVLIRQREYAHDVAVISLDFEGKVQNKYAHGAPVTIAWGWLPDDVEYFHGYVHHVKQSTHQQKFKRLDVYCVGASYRMKQPRMRSFLGLRAHQVAARIANEHRFSLTVSRHDFVHEHLTQHGRSDWDFLVWLAKRCGLTFYATKTDLVMVRRVIDRTPSHKRPTFRLTPGRYVQRGSIYSVDHKVGENVPGTDKKARVVGGVTDDGLIVQARKVEALDSTGGTQPNTKPVFGKVSQRRPVHSAAHADSLLEAEVDLHRFNVTASAELSGSAQVHQGSTIRLTDLDEDSAGFWYVGQVDHHITVHDYRIKVELARDTLGDAGTDPVLLSVSGKPVLLSGSDVGIEDMATPPPSSLYEPIEGAVPVEEAVAALRLTEQLPFDVNGDAVRLAKLRRSPARRAAAGPAGASATRTITRTGSRAGAATRTKVPPKLTGWKATHHSVRMRG